MGARGQVRVIDEDGNSIYLYTHWGVHRMLSDVHKAISRKERWDDPEYLTRIIFSEMVGACNIGGSEYYGIGLKEHGDIELLVTVDCRSHEVYVNKGSSLKLKASFANFINLDLSNPDYISLTGEKGETYEEIRNKQCSNCSFARPDLVHTIAALSGPSPCSAE